MVEAKNKVSSHCWWFDSHNKSNPIRSPWLQSTLAELDEKAKTMLKLVEEDADSFAKRAEMYYKRRPELINMVEDFYRAHRSLAERYDQVKSESGTRLITPWASPLSFNKFRLEKSISLSDKAYDSYSETYGPEESDESEVDDPEEVETVQDSDVTETEELMKLKEELKRLREENEVLKEQLLGLQFCAPESCINQNATKDKTKMKHTDPCKFRATVEETGSIPSGGNATPGPGAAIASGFGGLGLEGIVGIEDSLGESSEPPEEGKSGAISGDRAGGADNGG